MRSIVLLITVASLHAAAAGDGLVFDVKLGYLAAPTRHFSTATYSDQVPLAGGGTTAVAHLGIFPDEGTSNGPGLRFATVLSGRTSITWYAKATVGLLAAKGAETAPAVIRRLRPALCRFDVMTPGNAVCIHIKRKPAPPHDWSATDRQARWAKHRPVRKA